MRALFLIAVIGFFLQSFPAEASSSLINQTCTNLGQTQMDTDQVSIIACLQTSESNPALIWKSMLSSSGAGNEQCVGYESGAIMDCINIATGKVCMLYDGQWSCSTPSGYAPGSGAGPGTEECSSTGPNVVCINTTNGTACMLYSGQWNCSTPSGTYSP